jgi:hypothetical protein
MKTIRRPPCCIGRVTSRLRPCGPLCRLGVLHSTQGCPAIGPMAGACCPIDLGGPMCPMGKFARGPLGELLKPLNWPVLGCHGRDGGQ